ncbi:methyltransferase domain-containing protein [Actinoallomurus sp. NPDC050550]|uniref:class I SAM-dependent methyltransferase n=1 Tax=Actinoallomurus sp. NPDC050550 TaxID=3154937 RepID=UPI0033E55544
MTNSEQAEAWDGDTGRHWAEQQDRYDTMLSRLTDRLIADAAISAADHALDVGCGCGQTTRIAARQASEGAALGIDLSRPMLERARELAREEGPGNVRFERADAQVTDLPGESFDLVLSRFGVMFFDDPSAAFANLRRALRPGGRLAFLCWQDAARNEHLAVPYGAVANLVPLPDLGEPGKPGPFSLADPEHVRDLLAGVGFAGVRAESVTEPVRLGADLDDAVEFLSGNPVVRGMLAEADDTTIAKALDALRAALAPYETPDGVLLGSAVWSVTASRP